MAAAKALLADASLTSKKVAARFGVSKATLYRDSTDPPTNGLKKERIHLIFSSLIAMCKNLDFCTWRNEPFERR
jgi:hypothetical protein